MTQEHAIREAVSAPAQAQPSDVAELPAFQPTPMAEAPVPVSFVEAFQESVDVILSAHRNIDATKAGLRAAEGDIAAAQAKLEQAQGAAERATASHDDARTGARAAVRDLIGQLTAWQDGELSG